jgi:hypothetical protein
VCTNTLLGILCSNTLFPHNVFDIGFISRFSALLAFDLDVGVICPEIFDLDPDKSRGCFDFIRALDAIALIFIQVATSLFV